ncbi:MAG: glycogen debranching protein [Clostridiaceae bacterium]|nr:glycogen debranching protein [Clostridiaceae bacterium]
MKFENIKFDEGLKKEWIITNGIGGFASSSIIGANTRRYHGLLVAPLTPPARRFLILSKVDESIELDDKKYDLYTNICKNYISEGYKHLVSFEKEYIPIYTYQVEDVIIKKYICMEYGKNTVTLFYQIYNKNHKAKLTLTPIINFRDFHADSYNHNFEIKQEENNRKLKVIVDEESSFPIYMNVSEGKYIKHDNDSFKNMFYIEEEKRGFRAEENHAIIGRYEIDIEENETKEITFVASLEENIEQVEAKKIINKEIVRIGELVYNSELNENTKNKNEEQQKEEIELIRNYIIASDNFVVYRPSFGLHTIIAGYPWFLDWGRDTLISFEGLLLKTKRYEIAKEVLQTMIRDVKFGLVPNGYSGYDNRPLYNSVDSSLLLFEQIIKYIEYTKDEKFIKDNFYELLKTIIESYEKGIDIDNNNIYLDEDNLIYSGTEQTQNTWMDAKIGNYVVTPRNGKAVEINSMWYNALKIMEELTIKFDNKNNSLKYKRMADKCQQTFLEKFYNKKRKCLYDVIGDSKIRPNQLFSISLTYPILNPKSDIAQEMFETVTKKLLNNYGLKTLAKGEENYVEVYEGDSFRRDMSYHQGITWPWLLGLYYNGLKNMLKVETNKTKRQAIQKKYDTFVENVKTIFIKEFKEGKTVGGLSELYDSKKPFESKGTVNQAWSIAEVFRIILENK